jgi:hypothetical protein
MSCHGHSNAGRAEKSLLSTWSLVGPRKADCPATCPPETLRNVNCSTTGGALHLGCRWSKRSREDREVPAAPAARRFASIMVGEHGDSGLNLQVLLYVRFRLISGTCHSGVLSAGRYRRGAAPSASPTVDVQRRNGDPRPGRPRYGGEPRSPPRSRPDAQRARLRHLPRDRELLSALAP